MSPPPSTWPTTPSTASATIVLCVMGRSLPHRYIARAGVAKLVRRARLKIGWPPGYAGSSPAPGVRDLIADRIPRDVSPSTRGHGAAYGTPRGSHALAASLATTISCPDRTGGTTSVIARL